MPTGQENLNEFKGSSGTAKTVDPVSTGDSSRGADKSGGESTYNFSTKAEVLSAIMQKFAGMGKDEMVDIYHGIGGPSASPRGADKSGGESGAVDTAPTTVKPINPDAVTVTPTMNSRSGSKGEFDQIKTSPTTVKPIVSKEDVDVIFAGDELTEESKDKALIVFESVLTTHVIAETARLEEEFETKLNEAVEEIRQDVVSTVDKYLSFAVSEWVESNQLAIDNGLKVEMAEECIKSLKSVFESNYIEIPADKIDVVAEMSEENDLLKAQLAEASDELVSLRSTVLEAETKAAFAEISEGLAQTQIEKLETLAEGVSFTTSDDFKKKLSVIKEAYFGVSTPTSSGELLSEEFDGEESKSPLTGPMAAYVNTAKRLVKN